MGRGGGGGEHVLFLTHAQIARIEIAMMIGKSKVSIHLSKKQVKANVQHKGGFLGLLAGLAAKALPTILGGLRGGPSGIEKAIGGNGLYLHKSGHCVKVEPFKGNGLCLTPHTRLPSVHGDGLYLKSGTSIYDGRGLLLGSHSPIIVIVRELIGCHVHQMVIVSFTSMVKRFLDRLLVRA